MYSFKMPPKPSICIPPTFPARGALLSLSSTEVLELTLNVLQERLFGLVTVGSVPMGISGTFLLPPSQIGPTLRISPEATLEGSKVNTNEARLLTPSLGKPR